MHFDSIRIYSHDHERAGPLTLFGGWFGAPGNGKRATRVETTPSRVLLIPSLHPSLGARLLPLIF